MIWLRLIWWVFWRGLLWGAIEGAMWGTVIFPVVGTIFGIPIGAFIGAVVGCINGLILTSKIRLLYNELNSSQINQQDIRRIFILGNFIFTFLVLGTVGLIFAAKPLGSQVPNILIFGGSLPSLVEAVRAARFSSPFAHFATTQLSNLPSRQSPANVLS